MATRNFVPRANNEGGIGTSVKQWASGFFQKLAVGAITTAVTVLTPSDDANNQQPATTGWVRSQFQSILKTVLTAAGLKYNIATNGYICFGSLFGNLILQWGSTYIANVNKLVEINLPIEMRFPMHCFLSPVTNSTSGMVEPGLISFEDDKTTNHSILAYQYSGATRFARYLIIGN